MVFSLASCGAETVADIPKEEAAQRLSRGELGFLTQVPPSRMAEVQRISGEAPFYAGLALQRLGDSERANALFEAGLSSSSPSIRRSSASALIDGLIDTKATAIVSEEQQEKAREALHIAEELSRAAPGDDEARTLLAKCLAAAGDYGRLLDFYGSDNAGVRSSEDRSLFLLAAVHSEGPSVLNRAVDYFLGNELSAQSRSTKKSIRLMDRSFFPAQMEAAIEGRLSVYDRSYNDALYYFRRSLANGSELFFAWPELLSDLGKAFQYSASSEEGERLFLSWEKILRDESERYGSLVLGPGESNALRFRLLFYAGRIRRQKGDVLQAQRLFSSALPLAPDPEQRDACIWYLLDSSLSLSPASTLPLLRKYVPSWSSPDFYNDFLDRLCGRLVAKQDWATLMEVFRIIQSRAAGASIARYAYVLGRAVSLGYIGADRPLELLDRLSGDTGRKAADKNETARRFFRIAFEADTSSFYYRCLAASRLGENVDPIPAEERLNSFKTDTRGDPSYAAPLGRSEKPDAQKKEAAEDELAFLLGFFKYGAVDFALNYAQAAAPRMDNKAISSVASAFARSERWGDSIRFMSQLQRRSAYRMDRQDMELLYPRPFQKELGSSAKRWLIAEELLYGLVRTESAFIPDVVSHAGAVGLTQLMPATAKDVTARIRGSVDLQFQGTEVDLRDPATNANLGTWYLADLQRRLQSPMLALLSYNGGITRVRRWRAAEPTLPEDLFLETIEIAETRDYGRKVLAAAAVYGYLYYGMTLERVVADIFPE
ncbi:lytic transglycosylase domain-containing protein [Treponema sp.]